MHHFRRKVLVGDWQERQAWQANTPRKSDGTTIALQNSDRVAKLIRGDSGKGYNPFSDKVMGTEPLRMKPFTRKRTTRRVNPVQSYRNSGLFGDSDGYCSYAVCVVHRTLIISSQNTLQKVDPIRNSQKGIPLIVSSQLDAGLTPRSLSSTPRLRRAVQSASVTDLNRFRRQLDYKLRINNMSPEEFIEKIDFDGDGHCLPEDFFRGLKRLVGIMLGPSQTRRKEWLTQILCRGKDKIIRSERFVAFFYGEDMSALDEEEDEEERHMDSVHNSEAGDELDMEDEDMPPETVVKFVENTREKLHGRMRLLRMLFLDLDTEHMGVLGVDELRRLFQNIGVEISYDEANIIVEKAGNPEDGNIGFDQLQELLREDKCVEEPEDEYVGEGATVKAIFGKSRRAHMEAMIRVKIMQSIVGKFSDVHAEFLRMDEDGDDRLTTDEFRFFLRKKNFGLTIPEMELLIDKLDYKREGTIPFDLFAAFINFNDAETKFLEESNLGVGKGDRRSSLLGSTLGSQDDMGSVSSVPTRCVSELLEGPSHTTEKRILRKIYEKLTTHSRDLKEIFKKFDQDGDGYLSHIDFCRSIRFLNVQLSSADWALLFETLDCERLGYINFAEFAALFGDVHKDTWALDTGFIAANVEHAKQSAADSDQKFGNFTADEKKDISIMTKFAVCVSKNKSRIVELIRKYDKDGDKVLSHDEFRGIVSELGANLTQAQIYRLLLRVDPMKNGSFGVRGLMDAVAKPEKVILASRKMLQSNEGNDSSPPGMRSPKSLPHLISHLSLGDTSYADGVGGQRQKTYAERMDEATLAKYDRAMPYFLRVEKIRKLVSVFKELRHEHSQILHALRVQKKKEPSTCTAKELKDALSSIGIMYSVPDFTDAWSLLNVDGKGELDMSVFGRLCAFCQRYLHVRDEMFEDESEFPERPVGYYRQGSIKVHDSTPIIKQRRESRQTPRINLFFGTT